VPAEPNATFTVISVAWLQDCFVVTGVAGELAPEIFALDDIAYMIETGPDALMLAAAESCPSTAIRIIESPTGDLTYP
jgi:ferredoxin